MPANNFRISTPFNSVSIRQVEHFHNILLELARCLKIDEGTSDFVDVLLEATKYNKSIHSVINSRPVDVVSAHSEEPKEVIWNKIRDAQISLRGRENASRKNRVFEVDGKVLVQSNRKLGNILTPLCYERGGLAILWTTVLIKRKSFFFVEANKKLCRMNLPTLRGVKKCTSRNMLESLDAHYTARSLDFQGFILKVMGATPDDDDFEKCS